MPMVQKPSGETSFSADERSLLLKPTWNRSATIKIDETGSSSHQEYTLPNTTGTITIEEKINYLTAPDNTKWYIQNDGSFSNNLAG